MSGLMDSLSMATRSLGAAQAGLDTTGQNIANINTPGYTRRTVELAAVQPTDALSAGGGVDVVAVHSARAGLLEAQLLREQPAQGRESAMAGSLSQIERALGTAGGSVDAGLTDFFNAFTALAQDPSSGVARQQVTAQGQAFASTVNGVASRLTTAQQDADQQVTSSVDQINVLATQIASFNAALGGLNGSAAEGVRDKLGVALGSLAQLIDIGVTQRADGGADVSVAAGHALVIGASTYQLSVQPAAAVPPAASTGLADVISADGANITRKITGGQVGGVLQVRDVLLTGYKANLDQLAYDVATTVNARHQAGYDLNGTAGVAFFNPPPATVAGAANGLSVSAAVIADSRLIAASGTAAGAPGDNMNARALADLQQTALPPGTTNPIERWGALIYQVGSDSQAAANRELGHNEIVKQLQTLRDQVSAVSLDEEAANLTKFQRAYEANARYFGAIQTSLDVLMAMVT